jgi:DNA polymerase
MQRMATRDGRACDMFVYHRARTGRDGGADIQPQNLTKAGPKLRWCGDMTCEKPYGAHLTACPHCGADTLYSGDVVGWSWKAVDHALEVVRTGSLDAVEHVFGNALLTLSGCIRGLFTAAPGHELLCSDFSSIEAVVTAVLAGEEWRIQAFHRKEDIYLRSASRITGIPYEEYIAYYEKNGFHPPDRQKIGKPAELGLGFGGWLGAWRQFDKSDNFNDDEVKGNINAWRGASPMIPELWGGQVRGKPWKPDRRELFGLEGAAIAAVQDPGQCFSYRMISFGVKDDALFCRLPSGRLLTYHRPRLAPSTRWDGQLELTFEGYNSNPKMGPIGWVRLQTYGGRLAENVIQATARDIMRESVINLERAGYPIVLRVHDELAAEVPPGFGSVEEFETIMQTLPAWAAGWPIRAAGGWRGNRYRKD